MGRVSSVPDPASLSVWSRLADRAYGLRDSILASQRFQIMAARFPLTRRISAKRARDCFDLCAGFVYSQVLFACVKLDLFELLARRPLSVAEVARQTKLNEDAARRLLLAAASLDLLQDRGEDRFGLGQIGAAMRANPGVKAMIEHHAMFYADMADPVALLRGEVTETKLARYWPYADGIDPASLTSSDVAPYTSLMASSQQFVSTDVLDAATKLADSQSAEIRALTDHQISQVDLAFATGTLLGADKVAWAPVERPAMDGEDPAEEVKGD